MNSNISKATFSRLPLYLEYLKQILSEGKESVSATKIAKALNLGEVQARKDLSSVSGKGRPKTGYFTRELIAELEEILGVNKISSAVVVGAGRLGSAMQNYDGFLKYGLKITASFDEDESVVSSRKSNANVFHMSEFKKYVKENQVKTGIITVPKTSAQKVCDIMIKCGIKAIWNFAPCNLVVPEGVIVFQENLALSLAYLNYQLKSSEQ
ncbi:MAG: redox-sensing transcriptional repressor Rex [Clostridia bacterium]|nr:redox-sensing transcriptional repressor Rex [Clostridia bacterium]